MRAFNRLHDFLVTLAAGFFSYLTASGRDVNVVFKPARREIVGMPEAVARFSGVLRNQSGRCMAIITNGNCAMARLQPTAKLVLHDVTVHACLSVISHVRVAAGINEGVRTHTYRQCRSRHPG